MSRPFWRTGRFWRVWLVGIMVMISNGVATYLLVEWFKDSSVGAKELIWILDFFFVAAVAYWCVFRQSGPRRSVEDIHLPDDDPGSHP